MKNKPTIMMYHLAETMTKYLDDSEALRCNIEVGPDLLETYQTGCPSSAH
jgi:hypothetical protein